MQRLLILFLMTFYVLSIGQANPLAPESSLTKIHINHSHAPDDHSHHDHSDPDSTDHTTHTHEIVLGGAASYCTDTPSTPVTANPEILLIENPFDLVPPMEPINGSIFRPPIV